MTNQCQSYTHHTERDPVTTPHNARLRTKNILAERVQRSGVWENLASQSPEIAP